MTLRRQRTTRFVDFVLALTVGLATGPLAAQSGDANEDSSSAPETSLETQSNDLPSGDEVIADDVIEPEDEGWIDSGQGYAAQKANEMTQWVDNFFGNDERDLEQAESRLRLRTIYDWDQRLDNEFKLRLGGKVSLPQISKRLDLVFRGEDMDGFGSEGAEDRAEDRIGLQYQVGPREVSKHRFDLTVGFGSSGPKPGVKYVYENAFAEDLNFRFTQRFIYDLGDGAYGTSRFVLDKVVGDRQLLRAYTRMLYGEETEGNEWSTNFSYARGWQGDSGRVGATWVYVGAEGQTEPYAYVKNYRVGMRLRRQAVKDYLFWEVEPSYNWRIDEPYFDREGAWKVELRLEFLLFENPGETVERQIR